MKTEYINGVVSHGFHKLHIPSNPVDLVNPDRKTTDDLIVASGTIAGFFMLAANELRDCHARIEELLHPKVERGEYIHLYYHEDFEPELQVEYDTDADIDVTDVKLIHVWAGKTDLINTFSGATLEAIADDCSLYHGDTVEAARIAEMEKK